MMISSDEPEVYSLTFFGEEWERLLSGEKISRVTGCGKGCFQFEVKVKKIKDPYR